MEIKMDSLFLKIREDMRINISVQTIPDGL